MLCCSELFHYQTTLSIDHCARKPFNRRRLSGLPQCALSVWITAKVMPSIYNTHTHTLSQLRTQFTDACVCVVCSVCNVCLDFSHVILIFGGFVLLFAFLECCCLLSKVNCSKHTHKYTCQPLWFLCFVDSSFVASFNHSLAADLA